MACESCQSTASVANVLQQALTDDCFRQLRDDLLSDGRDLAVQAGTRAVSRVQEYLECQFSLSPAAAQAQAQAAWQGCIISFVLGLAAGKDRATLIEEGIACLIQSLLGGIQPPGPEPSGQPAFRPVSRC